MDALDVLSRLKTLEGPNRHMDWAIGQAIGYVRKVEEANDNGTINKKAVLIDPETGDRVRTLHYTGDLDAAYSLIERLAPGSKGGFSWEQGLAHAKIGSGEYFQAKTPQIALCMAAMDLLVTRQEG